MGYARGFDVRTSELKRWVLGGLDLSAPTNYTKELVEAVDIETNGKPWYSGQCRITTCAITGIKGTRVYVLDDSRDLVALCKRLNNPKTAKVFHNAAFDVLMLMRGPISVIKGPIHDTISMARCANNLEQSVGLDNLGKRYCKMEKLDVDKPWLLELEELKKYNARDAEITYLLYHHYIGRRDRAEWWDTYRDCELALLPVLCEMDDGAPELDYEWVLQFLVKANQEIKGLTPGLDGVNPNSPKQVSLYLWGNDEQKGLIKPMPGQVRGKKGDWSSAERWLKLNIGYHRKKKGKKAKKAVQWMEDCLVWRSWIKDLGFVKSLANFARYDGKVHASFLPFTAKTGRWSCKRPNLQQIPGAPHFVRLAFLSGEEYGGDLYSFDFDQMELRMGASVAGDKVLMNIFNEGGDPHTLTSKRVGITRDHAKVVIYCWMYGGGGDTMAEVLRVTVDEGKAVIRGLNEGFPHISRYMRKIKREMETKGKIYTACGRKLRTMEAYQAFDYYIQGSGADILKKALVAIWKMLLKSKSDARIVACIHDEGVFRVPKREKAKLKTIGTMMEEKELFKLPLTVSSGLFHEKS